MNSSLAAGENVSRHPLSAHLMRLAGWLAAIGATVLLISIGVSKSGQNIGGALLILSLAISGPAVWKALGRDRLTWATVAWLLAVFSSAVYASVAIGIPLDEQSTYIWRFSRLFLIPLVAWGMALGGLSAYRGYVLVFTGYLLGMLYYTALAGWPTFLTVSGRLDITGEGVQFYGLFSATAIIAAIAFGKTIHRHVAKPNARWLNYAFWFLIASAGINGLLISQARASLVALAVGLLLLTVMSVANHLRKQVSRPQKFIIAGGFSFAILGAFLFAYSYGAFDHSVDRFERDIDTLAEGPDPSTGYFRETSLGIRLNQLQAGVEQWQEHWLLGYGPDGSRYAREAADLPERSARSAPHHFHNIYMDLLVRFGVFGVAIASLFLLVYVASLRSPQYSSDNMSRQFALLGGTMFLVAGLTQTYWTSQVSWFYLAGVLSPALAGYTQHLLERIKLSTH